MKPLFIFRTRLHIPVVFLLFSFCNSSGPGDSPKIPEKSKDSALTQKNPVASTAEEILQKPEVPILCYHQVREFRSTDSKRAQDYIVPPDRFKEQMKMLHDSGFHSILPDELLDYLQFGKSLPPKPVMISFDDNDENQYPLVSVLDQYGFKAVYFIMTVSLNRPHYFSKDQVASLAAAGHVIGSHTWNHQNVKKFTTPDWETQVDKPTKQLQAITGKPVHYFAYPFGLWNEAAIPELKKRGFVAAFQLNGKRDPNDPLYTIRRMIIPGYWDLNTMKAWMRRNFPSAFKK